MTRGATNGTAPGEARDGIAAVRKRAVRWAFLDGNRLSLAGVVSGGIFIAAFALAWFDFVALQTGNSVTFMVGSLIGGMLPFITVVLAIVQLILSQEFGSAGSFRDRLEETEAFRERVESDADIEVSPTEPERFLRVILEATNERATALLAASESRQGSSDGPAVQEFARDLVAFTEGERERLEDAQFGTFEVIAILLEYNDTEHLHASRRLRVESAENAAELRTLLDEIQDLLEDVHVTRQYFKVVHVQQELANLSRLLLSVGFPALVGGGFFVLTYDGLLAANVAEPTLAFLTSLVVALVFAPFAVLLAYVLRIATIARRTAADFGPFHLQKEPLY